MAITGDAYTELGLGPDATEAQVKAAWRRLVSRWHPDRNADAAAVERIQRINQAYHAILRQRGGDEWDVAAGGDAPAAAAAEPPRRRTVARRVRLTLEEAAAGCTRELKGRIADPCAPCGGQGWTGSAGACAACAGAGVQRQRSWFNWLGATETCQACAGSGLSREPCAACGGRGHEPSQRYRLQVRIPHGARHGDVLEVAAAQGGDGLLLDLEIRVELRPHPLLRLEDDGTTRVEMPVDAFAWMANRSVEVPTLGGLQTLALHRERTVYRLVGAGFPVRRRGPPGDQIVQIVPVYPPHLSDAQAALLARLADTRSTPAARAADRTLAEWDRNVEAWSRPR